VYRKANDFYKLITQLYPPHFLTKLPKIYDGEKTATSTNVAGKSGYPSAGN
jgi:hypothetical protein